MNQKCLLLLTLTVTFVACGSKDDPEAGDPSTPLGVPTIDFAVMDDRLLSSLSDEEIVDACAVMADAMKIGDEGVSCRIQAAGTTSSLAECNAAVETCLQDPAMALSNTAIRTTPAPIDCSSFDASLTTSCDHTVEKLEDCANALAESVVPAADAVRCESAADFSDVDAAEEAAKLEKGTAFADICAPLLECEALVSALLTGNVPSGLGGAGGSE